MMACILGLTFFCFFVFGSTLLARQVQQERAQMDSDYGGAMIRKPGSAWLEGTPAMDHCKNGKRIHM